MSNRGDILVVVGDGPLVARGYEPQDLDSSFASLAIRQGFGVARNRADHETSLFVGSGLSRPAAQLARLTESSPTRGGGDRGRVEVLAETALTTVGHFAVLIIGVDTLLIATDYIGSTPVFEASTGGNVVVGTCLTDVAECANRTKLDEAAVEEYLLTGIVTHPATLFEGVYRIDPGAVRVITASAGERTSVSHPYWRPSPPVPRARDESRDLARAFRDELKGLLGRIESGPVSVLLSGGEDSRVLAAAAEQSGHDVQAITFVETPNREYRRASRVARLLDVELVERFRNPGHYASEIGSLAGRIGLDVDPRQVHALDLVKRGLDPEPVIDGWYAGLSKGHYSPSRRRRRRGIVIGVETPIPPRDPLGLPRDEMRNEAAIRARREAKAHLLSHLDDASLAEWMLQWPATDQDTVSFFLTNQRELWSLSPFLFRPMVELAASVPASARLNRAFFKEAFARSLGRAAFVPRTDGEVLGLPTRLDVGFTALHQLATRALGRGGSRVAEGSWPRGVDTWREDVEALLGAPSDLVRAIAGTTPAASALIEVVHQDGYRATLRESQIILRCAHLAHYVSKGL